jgi:hypothetical protein
MPWSSRARKNIPLYRNSESSYSSVTSSLSEGRIAIVTKRGVSGGGRGLRRASDCLSCTTGAVSRTAKSCGPDARGLCVKTCDRSQGDGGNSATLPEESATYAVKPLRREGRMFGRTCMPLCICSSRNSRTADRGCPAGTRSSLRPLFSEGARRTQDSGEICREDAEVCLQSNLSCPGRSAALLAVRWKAGAHVATTVRDPMGPGSAQQRQGVAARPGHETLPPLAPTRCPLARRNISALANQAIAVQKNPSKKKRKRRPEV